MKKLFVYLVLLGLQSLACAAPMVDLAKLPLYFCLQPSSISFGDDDGIINPHALLSDSALAENPSIYRTGFNASSWSGSLKKFPLIQNSQEGISLAQSAQWDAGETLNAMKPVQRKIVTYSTLSKLTVPFALSNLPSEAQGFFNQSPSSGARDNLGKERIAYLYGERAFEQASDATTAPLFRKRDRLLGDIIHSVPVYVGAAQKNIIGPNYSSFFEQFKNRPGTVYVGANDGMLHAFSSATGIELFAYIPSPLLNKLPKLTDPSYQHDAYMDGNIGVHEAQVNGAWTTVLAAGMGQGAKGVFALDITSPDAFMKGRGVLFEFTEKDDADMGYLTSSPVIAKLSVGKNSDQTKNYRYFVVATSGYNSLNPNADSFLFLLSLDKTPNQTWRLNKNYYKLKIANSALTLANALAKPSLVLDAQGAALYAYAGDLQGNVWRFDFASHDSPFSNLPVVIFTAKDATGRPQPITTQPVVTFAPGGGYLISFGTGKYLGLADANSARFQTQSFYSLRDNLAVDARDYLINSRDELAERVFTPIAFNQKSGFNIEGADFIYGDSKSSRSKKGWYVDFFNSHLTGERSIAPALVAYGTLSFNTLIPSAAPCRNSGTSNTYTLDLLTGKIPNAEKLTGLQSSIGLLVAPPVFLVTQSELNHRNAIGQRSNTQYYSILKFGTGPKTKKPNANPIIEITQPKSVQLKAGRLSWREIQNWQDLK
jgi:type IV pilus assembly protein PilY1